MRSSGLRALVLVAIVGCALAKASTEELRSPWDAYPVAQNDGAYKCPAAADLPHDFRTNSYYIDAHLHNVGWLASTLIDARRIYEIYH